MKGRETGGEFRGTGRCVTGMVRCLRSKLSVRIQSPIGYHSNLNSKLLNTSGFCGCFFLYLSSTAKLFSWTLQSISNHGHVKTIYQERIKLGQYIEELHENSLKLEF